MRKLFLVALFAMFGVGAFAQKGVMGVGVNLNYTPCLEDGVDINHFGFALKAQYGFTDAIRGEIQAGYDLEEKNISVFHAGANVHYLFNLTDKLKIYPVVGLGYASFMFDVDGVDADNKFYVQGGAGIEYDITGCLTLGLEAKYQYIDDFNRLPVSLGLTYKF